MTTDSWNVWIGYVVVGWICGIVSHIWTCAHYAGKVADRNSLAKQLEDAKMAYQGESEYRKLLASKLDRIQEILSE